MLKARARTEVQDPRYIARSARSVYLSFGNLDVKVTDNYFDLMPGETREITHEFSVSE